LGEAGVAVHLTDPHCFSIHTRLKAPDTVSCFVDILAKDLRMFLISFASVSSGIDVTTKFSKSYYDIEKDHKKFEKRCVDKLPLSKLTVH